MEYPQTFELEGYFKSPSGTVGNGTILFTIESILCFGAYDKSNPLNLDYNGDVTEIHLKSGSVVYVNMGMDELSKKLEIEFVQITPDEHEFYKTMD